VSTEFKATFAVVTFNNSLLKFRAIQMTDRGSNPGLWMATVGPHQPLKGVFYTQKFLSQNFCAFGRTSKAFTPRQLCDCRSSCSSAKLQCIPELGKLRFSGSNK